VMFMRKVLKIFWNLLNGMEQEEMEDITVRV